MNSKKRDPLGAIASAGAGALVGAGAFKALGGVGIAAGGSAVGITIGPIVAIGAGLGAAAYGLYWLGKQVGRHDKKQG